MREYAILMLGIAVCLLGATLMAFGEGLLGENHTGIAAVIGIVGIGLIGMGGTVLIATSTTKRSSKETKSSVGDMLND